MTITPTNPSPVPVQPLPVAPPRRINWGQIGVLSGITLLIVGCGITLLLKLGSNIGGGGVAIGVAVAIIPVPFLIAAFAWIDRYEPEPTRYLAFCLLWGAFVATLIALLLNNAAAQIFRNTGLPQDLVAVVVAPIVEESAKALGPVLLILLTIKLRRRTVNGIVDSIVFFGLSATGFAFSENILYLGGYGYDMGAQRGGVAGGLQDLLSVFIARVPLSGFAHPLFTSMTAIGVGIAVRSTDKRVKIIAPIAGWLGAMVLHGSWNLMSVLADDTGHLQILLYGYFNVFVPIFVGVITLVMYLRSAEGKLTQTALKRYVDGGWISPPEIGSLASIGRRRSARAWAERVAGKEGADGMRGFQLASTQLAMLRERMDRRAGAARPPSAQEAVEERQLLALITAYRTAYVGRDPLQPRALWDGSRYHIPFPDGAVRLVDPPPTPVVPVPVMRAITPPPYGYPYTPPNPYPPPNPYSPR